MTLYKMKQASELCGLSYETLKFYCNKGLIPRVKRDEHGFRVFDENDLHWIKSLCQLRKCGFHVQELALFAKWVDEESLDNIPERIQLLKKKQEEIDEKMEALRMAKQGVQFRLNFYESFLAGEHPYINSMSGRIFQPEDYASSQNESKPVAENSCSKQQQ